MVMATAPGKIILFGEHAVVYGRPAIAVPVFQVETQVSVEEWRGTQVRIDAADIGREYDMADVPPTDPIAAIIRLTCAALGIEPRGLSVRVRSTIPVARGLGSGAAVSVATARAIARYYGRDLSREQASALAFEVEKLHHGTPSGVDNTVVAFAEPIYYVRGKPFERFRTAAPFHLAIADTGIPSPTLITVGDVRRLWEADKTRYEIMFDQVGEIVREARNRIEGRSPADLGQLMNRNQELLREMGVSSPEIERLIEAARRAGANGAKLSGGGRGGNIIALVEEQARERVASALTQSGAASVIVTRVE